MSGTSRPGGDAPDKGEEDEEALDSERLKDVVRWLRYAREDLDASQAALIEEGLWVPRHACFMAQQAAEKAIKALLVYLNIDFPRRHDLDALRNLVPEEWSVKQAPLSLQRLTEWAVESRYPGDMPDPDDDDAALAVKTAREVYELVEDDLLSEGVEPDA